MRNSLRDLTRDLELGAHSWHLGLAYERELLGPDGPETDEAKAKASWLARLAESRVDPDYHQFVARWRAAMDTAGARMCRCKSLSRLLIGHGNPSGSDVGLTLHHTWGVPTIPGSALKGLLAHYVAEHYGPQPASDEPEGDPYEADESRRDLWRGVGRRGARIVRGPGQRYRELFGAPTADQDDEDDGAQVGAVVFHDAIFMPVERAPTLVARDILTVHQKRYYDSRGRCEAPSDHDEPNPVGFLTVKPGLSFLLALSGPAAWTELAMELLTAALDAWGVGGKTSLGYGRLVAEEDGHGHGHDRQVDAQSPEREPPASSSSEPSELFVGFMAALRSEGSAREVLADVHEQWHDHLLTLDHSERKRAATRLEKKCRGLRKKPGDKPLLEQIERWIGLLRAA